MNTTKLSLAVTACALALVGVADTVANRIRSKNSAELAAYTVTCTNGTGAARFDFKGNGGKFTILANGTKFETQWSACSTNSVYAYRDGVELLGWNPGQADFPASASEFEAWDWKRRATEVEIGRVVAFMEKGGRICAVRVVKVSDRSRGSSVDELQIEYRAY